MRYVFILILALVANIASAQQVNPVPDYTFANRMSAGRNTVTDTAAYFSIGPRYGAIRGMMPPMVVDTAAVSGNKRNGLLIFSVQKNKFLYWDSVGVKWAEMAGTGGTAINSGDTAAMLNPYPRGSGTVNYVPKFTGTRTLANSQIFDNGTKIGIGTTSPDGKLDVSGLINSSSGFYTSGRTVSPSGVGFALELGVQKSGSDSNTAIIGNINRTNSQFGAISFQFDSLGFNRRGTTFSNIGKNITIGVRNDKDSGSIFIDSASTYIGINDITPSYRLDLNGDFRSTRSTYLSTATGSVGVGTISPTAKMDVYETGAANQQLAIRNNGTYHTALVATSTSNFLTDSKAWGIFGGPNSYITGTTDAVGFVISNDVPFFQVQKNTNLNSGSPTSLLRVNNSGEVWIGGTTDQGSFTLQVTGAIYNTTTITTGPPTSGTAKPWRLGEAATVSPTSPNRTIRVEIDGTVYYLHAKTTND
jgi:hypothetical protein